MELDLLFGIDFFFPTSIKIYKKKILKKNKWPINSKNYARKVLSSPPCLPIYTDKIHIRKWLNVNDGLIYLRE